jgi:hypothetical protein
MAQKRVSAAQKKYLYFFYVHNTKPNKPTLARPSVKQLTVTFWGISEIDCEHCLYDAVSSLLPLQIYKYDTYLCLESLSGPRG